jgi:hypothetical protein
MIRSIACAVALMCGVPSAQAAAYGAAMPAGDATPISVAAASVQPGESGEARKFSGRVTEVCQAKGCWVMLEHDGHAARVMAKDHGFAVPKDARGQAVVYGTLTVKQLDAAAVEHFESESEREVASRELRIEATSIELVDG